MADQNKVQRLLDKNRRLQSLVIKHKQEATEKRHVLDRIRQFCIDEGYTDILKMLDNPMKVSR